MKSKRATEWNRKDGIGAGLCGYERAIDNREGWKEARRELAIMTDRKKKKKKTRYTHDTE